MKKLLCILSVIFVGTVVIGCAIPDPAQLPYPDDTAANLNAKAQQMSNDLEAYIKDWMAGKVGKDIPNNLIPDGTHPTWKKNFYLQTPAEVTPESVWGVRVNEDKIDFNALRNLYPDPHQTYLVQGCSYAPFGSKATIKGKFPRCRFFSIQATPSFDPDCYAFAKGFGAGETAIVDVDIEPDSGSVNPFRIGANRLATNRDYTVTLNFAMGKQNVTNPNLGPPHHRAPGNSRTTGMIHYMGSYWKKYQIYGMNAPGKWEDGAIWIRYQRLDKGFDAKAGVPLPTIMYQLPDGRQYYVNCDWSGFKSWGLDQRYQALANTTATSSANRSDGMYKQFGIYLVIAEAAMGIGYSAQWVRDLDKGATGRGEAMPAPANWESAQSCGDHYHYLCKTYNIGAGGRVVTVSGKLPTYPKTRNGEATMTGGELRYVSFSSYEVNLSDQMRTSICLTSVCDDEMVINANREYVLCYSRAADKPANANSAAGVTWINSGPTSEQAWTTRWCTVNPDWDWAKAPNEVNFPWSTTARSGTKYNKNLVGNNNHNGFMGMYQPVWKDMSKATFEGLGSPVTVTKVESASNCGSALASGTATGMMVLVPLMIALVLNGVWLSRRRRN